jgi:hypothetical protein
MIGIEGDGTIYSLDIINRPDVKTLRDALGLPGFNDVAV